MLTVIPKNAVMILLGTTLLVGLSVLCASCNSDRSSEAGNKGAAATARYHCPMHPTIVSNQPGNCPICGMQMVQTKEGAAAATPSSMEHTAPRPARGEPAQPAEQPTGAKTKIIYRSTMNPAELSDHPGKDSMGMEMVPEEVVVPSASAGPAVPGRATIHMSSNIRQLIDVHTTAVERRPLVETIRTVGRVTYDETRLHHIQARISGWVQRLYANTTGTVVKQGEPLLTIYSPELVSSAQEYLIALHAREKIAASTLPEARQSAERLVDSARRRLLLFDLSPQQIAAIEHSGKVPTEMTLHAPSGGYIITRNVTEGDKIEPGMTLLDIADLSHVWVLADIYEYELPFVHLGQPATVTLSYLPGHALAGQISLIYPVVSAATRTIKVRLEFANPDVALKPEMYADVDIHADLGVKLVVPASAVISTGTRNIAFIERSAGTFEPREVEVGVRLPHTFEILAGLTEGEQVVTSANFLVDSESTLQAALSAATTDQGDAPAEHRH
jgi:membrane fusion protein, copper/silver efflux system